MGASVATTTVTAAAARLGQAFGSISRPPNEYIQVTFGLELQIIFVLFSLASYLIRPKDIPVCVDVVDEGGGTRVQSPLDILTTGTHNLDVIDCPVKAGTGGVEPGDPIQLQAAEVEDVTEDVGAETVPDTVDVLNIRELFLYITGHKNHTDSVISFRGLLSFNL